MNRLFPKCRPNPGEEGYMLVAVIFMMAILVLSLAVAIPKVRQSIQRDREVETFQRGKQYTRAIQLYYRKFHAYPPNVDALVKTNEIRFLRKKYIDPTTGKDEWKPIMYGQNKTPCAMGFFGQPLAAIGAGGCTGGIGPSGGNLTGQGSTTGGGLFNSSPTTGAAGTATTPATGTDPSTQTGATPGTPGAPSQTGTPTAPGSTIGTSNPIGSGQSFGGAGIIGFSPQSPKQSILVYKKKNHYNDWEFLYSPAQDQQQMAAGTGLNGQPASGGLGTPTNPASGANGTSGSTPTGGNNYGTGGSAGTTQTPPQ
ncbi:MAG: type II secretion system protein [Acidobacteria bacterium]|nr:type II secretion system protein [Acidobacteriota bacterium]